MNTRHLLTLVAMGGVIALAACSSSDDDSLSSADSFCAAKAEAYCNNGLEKRCLTTSDACQKDQAAACNSAASAAAAQGRSYRSSQAQTCIDSVKNTYRNGASEVTAALETETATICDRVFTGSTKENATCTETYECEGSLICDKGICITKSTVGLGGQCNNAGAVCDDQSYCQPQGQTRFCVAKNKLGDSCGADAPCIASLRCLTGRCAALVPRGNPCDTDNQCEINVGVLYCAAATKTCVAKYESSSAACDAFGN